MELRHLHYFIAVAEELHFTRAAERLHMAQPPLSQQIRDLETQLGIKLFERTKRHVELTPAGKVFLTEARLVLAQADRAVKAAQRAGRGEIGQLIIGFNSSATYSVLPKILQRFRDCCPEVELILHELTTSQQLELLRKHQIHVGLLYLPLDDAELKFISVLKEPLMVTIPDTHPLRDQPQISLHALKNTPFIMPPHHLGGGLYRQIIKLFQQTNFQPQVVQEAIVLQTAISLVAGGVGVTIVPASLQNLQRPGVIYKPLVEPTPEIEIAVAWRPHDSSPVLQNLINAVQELVSTNLRSTQINADQCG